MGTPKLKDPNFSFDEEELDVPLDIQDIITVCREYSKLGWHLQRQIEAILEFGNVEEAIKMGQVKKEALPHIKEFLMVISNTHYFGDAAYQAHDCIFLIERYQDNQISSLN